MVSSVRRGLLIPKCFESDDRGRGSPDGELGLPLGRCTRAADNASGKIGQGPTASLAFTATLAI